MADADAVTPEPGDLAIVEMDRMRDPDAAVQPAAAFEEVDGGAAVLRTDEIGLLARLDQMRVQTAIVDRRQLAVSSISRKLTSNGAFGASATCVIAPSDASW